MFATKRRLTAMLLIVGFLVASWGMFVPQTEGQLLPLNCSQARSRCCIAIWAASQICGTFGSGSEACNIAQRYAGGMCRVASEMCNNAFSCS